MSQTEDPAVTLMRLLRHNLRVIKDDGSLASVMVSEEWQNSDALRVGDGQITVALSDRVDQKIELTGKIRRCTPTLRVNVWATDTPNATETGKNMRLKIVNEVNRIICENRTKPNQTTYSFVGTTVGGAGCRAFGGDTEAAPTDQWTELSAIDYQKLWYSDNIRCEISVSDAGKSAVLLLGFKIENSSDTAQQLTLVFEGYGTAPSGDGVVVKVWSHVAQEWQNAVASEITASDTTLTLTLQTDLPSYIDADGYVWLLAETAHASDGQTAATLCCDTASCTCQVNGVTYLDVAGYRNLDRVDVKPPIYRTEFSVKSWFIKNIGV